MSIPNGRLPHPRTTNLSPPHRPIPTGRPSCPLTSRDVGFDQPPSPPLPRPTRARFCTRTRHPTTSFVSCALEAAPAGPITNPRSLSPSPGTSCLLWSTCHVAGRQVPFFQLPLFANTPLSSVTFGHMCHLASFDLICGCCATTERGAWGLSHASKGALTKRGRDKFRHTPAWIFFFTMPIKKNSDPEAEGLQTA